MPILRIVVLMCALTITCAAHAAGAERTFVSATGSDDDRCGITSPCRTFAVALTRTLSGGEIVVLDSAGYGSVTIAQSVSIIAPAGVYAGVTATANGVFGIRVLPGIYNVKLSGLTISGLTGSSLGIWAQNSGQLTVESCVLSGAFQGVYIEPASGLLRTSIKDTLVHDTGIGVYLHAATGSSVIGVVDHVRIDRAQAGLYLRGDGTLEVRDSVVDQTSRSAAGVSVVAELSQTAVMSVTNSVVSNGGGIGVAAEDTGGIVKLYLSGNTVVGNAGAGIVSVGRGVANSSTTVVASRNNVFLNLYGIQVGFNSVFESFGDNAVRDNGTDVSGTITTGDVVYH